MHRNYIIEGEIKSVHFDGGIIGQALLEVRFDLRGRRAIRIGPDFGRVGVAAPILIVRIFALPFREPGHVLDLGCHAADLTLRTGKTAPVRHVGIARAVHAAYHRQHDRLLLFLVGFSLQKATEMNVTQIKFYVVEARQNIGLVFGGFGGGVQIKMRQPDQIRRKNVATGWIEALVIILHVRRGWAEGFVVKILQNRVGIRRDIP